MTDIEARADRIRAIAECAGGKVLSRLGDTTASWLRRKRAKILNCIMRVI